MFEHLTKYKKIIVSGPQRSGTQICSRMIAHDTKYGYLDEKTIHVDSLYALVNLIVGYSNFVLQAPGISRYIHQFGVNEDIGFVFMIRDIDDIIASQERIDWNGEGFEKLRYDTFDDRPIAQIKYDFWYDTQKPFMGDNAYEIHYEDLSQHPLWVPKEQRQGWEPHQTERQ